jgi:hypothetical protein
MITYADTLEGVTPEQLTGFFAGWPDPPSPAALLRLLQRSDYRGIAFETATNRVVDISRR